MGKNEETLVHLLQQARERVSDFLQHNTVSVAPVGRPLAHWQPPGPGLYKVNVDGALFMQIIQRVWVWSSEMNMVR